MPILRLIAETPELSLAPEETAALATAFEETLLFLELANREDPVTQVVAEKIIAIARTGERDPQKIKQAVLDWLA